MRLSHCHPTCECLLEGMGSNPFKISGCVYLIASNNITDIRYHHLKRYCYLSTVPCSRKPRMPRLGTRKRKYLQISNAVPWSVFQPETTLWP